MDRNGPVTSFDDLIVALTKVKGVLYEGGDNGHRVDIPINNKQILSIGSCENGNNNWIGISTKPKK